MFIANRTQDKDHFIYIWTLVVVPLSGDQSVYNPLGMIIYWNALEVS